MKTGTLTPRSNDCVKAMRFSGSFGQPDGFASVLDVKVNQGGNVSLSLTYKGGDNQEHMWAVALTDSQRRALAVMLAAYEPRVFEYYEER